MYNTILNENQESDYEILKELKLDTEIRKIFSLFLLAMNYPIYFLYDRNEERQSISIGLDNEFDILSKDNIDFQNLQKSIENKDYSKEDCEKFSEYLLISLGHLININKIDKKLMAKFIEFSFQNQLIELVNPIKQLKFTAKGKEFLKRFHMI